MILWKVYSVFNLKVKLWYIQNNHISVLAESKKKKNKLLPQPNSVYLFCIRFHNIRLELTYYRYCLCKFTVRFILQRRALWHPLGVCLCICKQKKMSYFLINLNHTKKKEKYNLFKLCINISRFNAFVYFFISISSQISGWLPIEFSITKPTM